ncbi:MAG: hypothetical protein ABL876_06895 [Chitinophagaceae bacterium]
MTDTPKHIKDIQLQIWLSKTPGERLHQFILDNDCMYKALREFKISNGLPLGNLDPVGEYLQKMKEKEDKLNPKNAS